MVGENEGGPPLFAGDGGGVTTGADSITLTPPMHSGFQELIELQYMIPVQGGNG